MYVLALVIILGTLIISCGGSSIFIFLDIPSILIVIFLSLSLLHVSGLFNDFRRALKIMTLKENNFYSISELKRSELAVNAFKKLVFLSGIFATLIGIVAVLALSDQGMDLLKSASVAMLTTLYSLIIIIMITPIENKIKGYIIDLNSEDVDEL